MPRKEGGSGVGSPKTTKGFAVDRRSYLKLAGTAAGSAALLSAPASASFSRRGITFERTVDMVADAGCDPTGTEPCDRKIRDAADDFTLLKFPDGEYKLTEKNFIYDKTNVGFLGVGNVRFSVPERFNEKLLVVDGGTGVLFEGIDIDQTADGATPALHLGAEDDLRVHDVQLIGQGIHPDSIPKGQPGYSPGSGPENGNPDVQDFFYPIVRSSDGTGLITNVVANNHGLMGTYNAGNGRSGIWVGLENKGTTTFRDCRIEEFGSDGTYSSRTYGVVQFEGGVYRNSDENQIRIGSPGSYIDGAKLVIDTDSSQAPNPDEGLNYRGARIEVGHNYTATDVAVRNCDIAVLSTPHTSAGVVAQHTASEFRVEDTRIQIDADNVRGVLGQDPDGGAAYAPPPKPHAGTLKNVSITGTAADGAAVQLVNRPDSVVENCCIQQTGANRDGIILVGSDGTTVSNSSIDVTGQQIDDRDSNVQTNNISTGGSCPVTEYGAGDSLPHTLSFESNGGRFSYEFTVSGDLGKSTARGATIDSSDTITDNSATGQGGGGGVDSYGFSGTITDLDVDGDATVYLDGQRLEISHDQTLVVEANGSYSSYAFSVSGGISPRQGIGGKDRISGSNASGAVGGDGTDAYGFSGVVTDIEVEGNADVYINGNRVTMGHEHTLTIAADGSYTGYEFATTGDVSPRYGIGGKDTISGSNVRGAVGGTGTDSYGFSGSITDLDVNGDAAVYLDGQRLNTGHEHTLLFEANGSYSSYEFAVSGGISPRQGIGGKDKISGSRATGAVGGSGHDAYGFSGDLRSIDVDGNASVLLDGKQIEADRNVLTIESNGDRFSYRFSTSGDLAKSTAMGASIDDNDELSGTTASGQGGGGGLDSYRFSGEVTEFFLDGDATLYRNGTEVRVERYLPRVLTVEATGPYSSYAFSATDGIAAHQGIAGKDAINVDKGRATGAVSGDGRDSYAFAGKLRDLNASDDLNVYVDGNKIA